MGKREERKKVRIPGIGKAALILAAAVFILHKKEWND
jgi:hypothetical protein